MNIGSIGSSALSPAFSLRLRSFAKDHSSDTAATPPTSTACAAGGICAAPLPKLSPVQAPSGLTVQESHLALQIRSRTEVLTASDGTVSELATAKLRFHYDLTTADGQHIELNVKAKVQQVSIQDAAGNSASKTQVKLQFSLLQQGVADALSSLQSDQVPSDTQSGVADRLQAFLNSVGDALQHFVEGDKVTADDLVRTTVDTFNTLVDALRNLLFQPVAEESPPALPTSDEAVGQIPAIAPPPPDNSPLSPAEPAANSSPAAPVAPLPAERDVINEPSESETPTVASEDNSVADVPVIHAAPIPSVPSPVDPTPAEPIPVDQGASPVQAAPAAGSVAPPADPNTAASLTQLLATQVLQTVRFRFVQSLTQIIQTLTPAEQTGNSSSSSFQRLDYRSSLSLRIHTTSLVDLNA